MTIFDPSRMPPIHSDPNLPRIHGMPAPAAPKIEAAAAAEAAAKTDVESINLRIQTLISEYNTLNKEVTRISNNISEISAKPAPKPEAIDKEKEAISKILKQMSTISTHLKTEFGKLDAEFVKISTAEASEQDIKGPSPERLEYLKALQAVAKWGDTVGDLLEEFALNPNASDESVEHLKDLSILYRARIQPLVKRAQTLLNESGITPANLELLRKEQRQLHEKRGFSLADLRTDPHLKRQMMLRLSSQDAKALEAYIKAHPNLSNTELEQIRFIPKIETPQKKKAYERCETHEWNYKKSGRLTFKDVLDICLKEGWGAMKDITPIRKEGVRAPSYTDIRIASGTNIEWTDAQRNVALEACNKLNWMDGDKVLNFAQVIKLFRAEGIGILQRIRPSGDISENEIRAALGIVIDVSWKVDLPISATLPPQTPVEVLNQKIGSLLSEFAFLNREYANIAKNIATLERTASPEAKEKVESERELLVQISKDLAEKNKELEVAFLHLEETLDKLTEAQKEKGSKERTEIPVLIGSAFRWADAVYGLLENMELNAGMNKESIKELTEVYQERIKPLRNKAQEYIKAQRGSVGTAAAGVGRSVQAAFTAIRTVDVLPTSRIESANLVNIVGKIAVYKQMGKQAEEETKVMSQLADFYSSTAVLHRAPIARAQPSREISGASTGVTKQIQLFEMDTISKTDRMRGHTYGQIVFRGRLFDQIYVRLSKDDKLKLKIYKEKAGEKAADEILIVPKMEGAQKVAYEKCEKYKWEYTTLDGEVRVLTFKKLQELCFDRGWHILNKVKAQPIKGAASVPSFEDIRRASGIDTEWNEDEQKKALEICRGAAWKRSNGDSITFDDILLNLESVSGLRKLEKMNEYNTVFENLIPEKVLWTALGIIIEPSCWEIILPEQVDATDKPIEKFTVQPFADKMMTVAEIGRECLAGVWRNLTPEAQHQAFMTAELQFMDLHGANLGMQPVPTPEYEKYNKIQNFYPALFWPYLKGTLTGDSVVTFKDIDGIEKTGQIKHFPDLQKALQVKWEFVLFDTDRSMGESNYLITHDRNPTGTYQTYLPVRSVFLLKQWKDEPLTKDCLDRINEADKNEGQMSAWIKGHDRPIHKRLADKSVSEANRKLITDTMQAIIDRFNFSTYRDPDDIFHKEVSIEDVANSFAKRMSRMPEDEKPLWEALQTEVGHMTLSEKEGALTLEDFATKHHLDIDNLRKLNPDLAKGGDLKPGTRIKTLDLISDTPKAKENRRKIAKQFYPRLTPRQETAFFERREARKIYLAKHQELQKIISAKTEPKFEELQKILSEYISKPYAPLSTARRSALETQIKGCADIIKLQTLAEGIVVECQPTCANIQKVMYPLLADAYELSAALYGEDEAGTKIGAYNRSLEMQIALGLEAGRPPEVRAMALKMQAVIEAAKKGPPATRPAYLY